MKWNNLIDWINITLQILQPIYFTPMSDSKFEPKNETNKSSSSQRDSEEEKDQVPENIEGNSQQFTHPKANP